MSNKRIYYSHEAEIQARRERAIATILFLALGLCAGAILALLFAPTSGKETREGIIGSLEDQLDNSRQVIHRLEDELRDLRSRLEQRRT